MIKNRIYSPLGEANVTNNRREVRLNVIGTFT